MQHLIQKPALNVNKIFCVQSDYFLTYTRKALPNGVRQMIEIRDALGTIQSIVTSTAQNDSGMFEVKFKDQRHPPFEGAGAISLWHLQLTSAVRQLIYNTISDVIMHIVTLHVRWRKN